jgi:hypothetical protein
LSQLRTGWNVLTATYTNDLPAGTRNVSGFEAVQFRISVNFADSRNTGIPLQNFQVELTDGNGISTSVRVSDVSGALFFPPGTVGPVPKVVLNTVRIPLSSFPGVNLSDVRTIRFRLNQIPTGAVLVTDIAFASKPGLPLP